MIIVLLYTSTSTFCYRASKEVARCLGTRHTEHYVAPEEARAYACVLGLDADDQEALAAAASRVDGWAAGLRLLDHRDGRVPTRAGVTPPLRLTSLTLTPGAVNVTTAAQTITADIGIASDAGFSEGVLALHRASFSGVTEIPLQPANRISGTANAGVYRVAVTIPRYSSPGTWLVEVAASDAQGREAVFGRGVAAAFEYDHVLPDGLTGLFSVANTGAVDEAAPALPSFAISPGTANVVVSPAVLTFTLGAAAPGDQE